MRITGGALCRRLVKTPEGLETRPTQDRVRESLFAILGARCSGALVLDLFAGSGSLGFEAISRGAKSCTFVESSRRVALIIDANASSLGVREKVHIVVEDAAGEKASWKRQGGFDIVFMDPPYASDDYDSIMWTLSDYGIINPMGVVVVERTRLKKLASEYGMLTLRRSEKYGTTFIDFYQYTVEG